MVSQEWAIRTACGKDLNFIYSTWLNSFRHDSRLGCSTRKTIFFQEYYGVVDRILSDSSTIVLVACLPEDTNVILAFLVAEVSPTQKVIHYAFTKESFRRLGIGKSLLHVVTRGDEENVFFTHETRSSKVVCRRFPKFNYNPFLLFLRQKQSK